MTDTASPKHRKTRDAILLAIRLIAGGLFVFAAIIKLSDLHAFAEAVKGFKLFPEPAGDHLILVAAFFFPWTELVTGILLLMGLWTRAASLIVLALLLGFIGAIVSVIYRDMNLECGCFGKIDFVCQGPIGWCSVVRNAVHASLVGVLLICGPGRWALESTRKAS